MRSVLRILPRQLRACAGWSVPIALTVLGGCTGSIDGEGSATGSTTSTGTGGSGSSVGGSAQGGQGTPSGTTSVGPGGSGTVGSSGSTAVGGASPGAGGSSTAGGATGNAGSSAAGAAATSLCPNPTSVHGGRAPLRRLTPFEYNNTVRDLLGDTTNPANALPSDSVGNGFGNDADQLSVSSLLAEQLEKVAEGVATRATANATALGKLAPCASNVAAANEETCARTVIETFAPLAYRRTLVATEVDDLHTLYKAVRPTSNFATGIAAVLRAILQAPDFLYRVEWGATDPAVPGVLRLTGDEIATRLSYFLWGTAPDATLRAAAKAGDLSTKQGVATHAERMVADMKVRPVVRYFFDSLLPLSLTLERDATKYPTYNPTVRSLMREETQRFLEGEIFDANGTWSSVLTAPYTYVNQTLATFYGMPGVTGDTFQKVAQDPTKRVGVLLQGSVLAGTTTSNYTNPVLRGGFIVHKLMCRTIPLPTGDLAASIFPPDPTSGATGRERFSQHSKDPVCAGCHQFMDPLGLALENYDAIGLYRTTENGVTIDASGSVPGTDGAINGGVELVQKLATSQEVQDCFATHWTEYAYGLTLRAEDVCAKEAVTTAFKSSGGNIKKLLVALTQTDAFNYLPAR